MASSRPRVMARVVDALGIAIMAGDLAPGATLPNESDLGVNLKAGRSAVREALKVLTAKGMVHARPRRGTWVRDEADWAWCDPDVLRWMESARREPAAVEELVAVAEAMEAAVQQGDQPLPACLDALLGAARRLRARERQRRPKTGTAMLAAR